MTSLFQTAADLSLDISQEKGRVIRMPGPMSAPNGDKSVVQNAKKREELRAQGKLYTGKTDKNNK